MKHCPQCGSSVVKVLRGFLDEISVHGKPGRYVVCMACGYPGPLKRSETAAINSWNKIPREKE